MMTTQPTFSHAVGELCLGADWACAHGDLETLGHVAGRLAVLLREHPTLHAELLDLERKCYLDAEGAMRAWMSVKRHVGGRS